MFLLVPAYPGCPGSKAVKRSLVVDHNIAEMTQLIDVSSCWMWTLVGPGNHVSDGGGQISLQDVTLLGEHIWHALPMVDILSVVYQLATAMQPVATSLL